MKEDLPPTFHTLRLCVISQYTGVASTREMSTGGHHTEASFSLIPERFQVTEALLPTYSWEGTC